MLYRGCLLVCLVLIAGQVAGGEESWLLRGRVVDRQGRPVADVGVTTFWNANGVSLEELRRIQKEGGDATKLEINEEARLFGKSRASGWPWSSVFNVGAIPFAPHPAIRCNALPCRGAAKRV